MKRVGALVAASVLGGGLLCACGGDGGSDADAGGDYCSTLADAQEEFAALEQGDVKAFNRFREVAGELEQQAPEEVADDWKVVNTAFDDLEQKLSDAGITFDDLEGISSGQLPEGVTREDLLQLNQDLQDFSTEGRQEAGQAIQDHARTECDIDLQQ